MFCLIKSSAPHSQNSDLCGLNIHTHKENERKMNKRIQQQERRNTEKKNIRNDKYTNNKLVRKETKIKQNVTDSVEQNLNEKKKTEKSLSFNRFKVKMCGSILALETVRNDH